jgi:Flp pilus assembly protein TadD
MHNLAGLYKDMGNTERSDYFHKRVRQYRNANPYYLYRRAQENVAKQDYTAALVLIKKAIEKEENEARFYTLAASIYERLGETVNVQKMRDKLYQIRTIRF